MASIKLFSFQFEPLILKKIESTVEEYLTAKFPTTKPTVLYLDFEPSEMMINALKSDGVIACFVRTENFPEGSQTATQTGTFNLEINAYGFGDPIEDETNPGQWESSVKEAQNRAEIFVSLIYRAVMDRVEIVQMFQPNVLEADKIDFTEKFPVSIQKFAPFGAMGTNRGICIYTSIYKMRVEEDPPTEALDDILAGSSSTSETYNPGDEPAG
ncbi:hypothetical protein KAR91_02140 [Candidatus Pacearchaeota archaeon]|nr:hypothetical protein [Candidatus Pacearchaeota archaeon]